MVGYLASIELANAQGVRPSMTATVQIVIDQHDGVLMVPNRALSRAAGGQQVKVVTPDGVEARTVRVGLSNDQNTEVTSGLQEGDQVATSGGLGLEDKAKVAIQQPKVEEEEEDKDKEDEKKDDKKDDKGKK